MRFMMAAAMVASLLAGQARAEEGKLSVHVTGALNATPDEVWRLIGDFNALPSWYPTVIKSRFDPATQVRTLTFPNGNVVTEKRLEDAPHRTVYTTIKGSLPVRNYRVTLTAQPSAREGRTVVEWWSTFDAKGVADADAVKAVTERYEYGIQQLEARFNR